MSLEEVFLQLTGSEAAEAPAEKPAELVPEEAKQ